MIKFARKPWARRLEDLILVLSVAILGAHPAFEGSSSTSRELWIAGLNAVASLGLLPRRRHPVAAFATQLAFAAAFTVVARPGMPPMVIDAGVLVGLYGAAVGCRRRTSLAALGACLPLSGWELYTHFGRDASALVPMGAAGVTFLVVAWMSGYWEQKAGVVREAARTAEEARRRERSRTARELHDVISRTVAAMLRQAAGARADLDVSPDRTRGALDAVQQAGVQAMTELRRMLVVLRLGAETESGDAAARARLRRRYKVVALRVADGLLIAYVFLVGVYGPVTDHWHDLAFPGATLGAGALVVLGLTARWRRPKVVFLVSLAFAVAAGEVYPEGNYVLGLLVAFHAVVRRCGRRVSVVAALVGMAAMLHGYRSEGYMGYIKVALWSVPVILTSALGDWMGQVTRTRSERNALERARRDERLRTSQELHDIVSHTVTVMLLQAAGARAVLADDPDHARGALDAVQEAGGQAMAELEQLLAVLGLPAGGERLHPPGLDGLGTLLHRMREAGLTIDLVVDGAPARLDTSVEVTAYRVVREALTNAGKYGGSGCVVEVRFEWGDHDLRITVADRSGPGRRRRPAGVPSTGHGLIGLDERVTAIGGRLVAEPREDGFVVTAMLPTAVPAAMPAA